MNSILKIALPFTLLSLPVAQAATPTDLMDQGRWVEAAVAPQDSVE